MSLRKNQAQLSSRRRRQEHSRSARWSSPANGPGFASRLLRRASAGPFVPGQIDQVETTEPRCSSPGRWPEVAGRDKTAGPTNSELRTPKAGGNPKAEIPTLKTPASENEKVVGSPGLDEPGLPRPWVGYGTGVT